MRETKVNLKHLLEDIRDSYTIPLEEIIIVELVANALDSGASRISFLIDSKNQSLTVVDNGKGMKRQMMSDYHNIAAATKKKGRGIGFAGVGAKLSLLLASKVITETKGGYGSRCATEWRLKSDISAPWKFVPFLNKVTTSRGTAVTLNLVHPKCPLLSEDFIVKSVCSNFFTLFQNRYFETILKHIYKKGVEFFVNGKQVTIAESHFEVRPFEIRMGGRNRRLVGCGYLAQQNNEDGLNRLPLRGLAISTFGKVIKSGWEWIGLEPEDKNRVFGVVEIPALAEILTTNKMDFLKSSSSLRKYYQYRKAIQEALMPILQELGETADLTVDKRKLHFLSRDIERALRGVIGNFPELVPLLGIKGPLGRKQGVLSKADIRLVGVTEKSKHELENNEKEKQKEKVSSSQSSNRDVSVSKRGKKDPAITIGFEDRADGSSLARMVEDKIWINTSHPAYFRAQQKKMERYHIVLCVAWVLSRFLDDERSPQIFINDFLSSWGRGDEQTATLFGSELSKLS